jgi:signal transduction histidine kinase
MRRMRVRWEDRLLPRTTTARIAIGLFLSVLLGSATIAVFVERVTQAQIEAETLKRIASIRDATVSDWKSGGPEAGLEILNGELQVPGPLVIHLARRDGDWIAGNMERWPASLPTDSKAWRILMQHNSDRAPHPYLFVTARLPDGHRLAVGRSLQIEEELQMVLAEALAAALLLALLLSALVTRWLTGVIGQRAQTIADAVDAVTAGDLSARVAVPDGPPADSFDSMGQAFNVMLTRLQGLLDELRAITDGLAHDLRSPLARLKARTDRLGLGTSVDAGDLAAISQEADSLIAMLDNSLEITRAEAGIGRDSFNMLDVAALVTDLAEMYEPLAEDKGVALVAETSGPLPVLAHRQLLGRALSNLIDNALRYGGSGDAITLAAKRRGGMVQLVVADRGPGIPSAQRGEALRRFGRLDAARQAGERAQGAGLGLSLAAAVARLHGGTLHLADNRPGLKVTIEFPVQPAANGGNQA